MKNLRKLLNLRKEMDNTRRKTNKGITLINVLIMVIVIVILVSVAITGGIGIINHSKNSNEDEEITAIKAAVNRISLQSGTAGILTPAGTPKYGTPATNYFHVEDYDMEDWYIVEKEDLEDMGVTYVEGTYAVNYGTNEVYALSEFTDILDNEGEVVDVNTSAKYTINFLANDPETVLGTMTPQSFIYGVSAKLKANQFTKKGYHFSAWTTNRDGTGEEYLDNQKVINLVEEDGGSLDLYTKWEANPYRVIFYANGGTGDATEQYFTYDIEQNLNGNNFSRTGYSFKEWNTKADGTGTAYADAANVKNLNAANNGATALYAQWNANTYTVKFDPNGGTGTMANQQMTYGQATALTENAFTKEGNSFNGWNTKADGTGARYSDKASVINLASEGETTLYAQWNANSHIITIVNVDGATITKQGNGNYGETITIGAEVKDGYAFESWVVTDKDGNEVTVVNKENTQATFTMPNTDVTVTVSIKAVPYTITYDLNAGTVATENPETYTVRTESFTLNNPTKIGYVFTGWTGSNGSTPQTTVTIEKGTTGNLNYTANYQYGAFTVTFNAGAGVEVTPSSKTVTYGEKYGELPTPTKTGYTLDGWFTSLEGGNKIESTSTVQITSDTTLYAHWKANKYNVIFNYNGGEGSMASQEMTYDKQEALTANAFTRTGYTFKEWNTKANGTGTAYTNKQEVKNLTSENNGVVILYAQWKENQYTVKYDANGGEGSINDQKMTYNHTTALVENTFTKVGCTFASWNTKADGTGTSYANKQEVNNLTTENNGVVTLYAQWKGNNYTVKFDANGGTGSMADQMMVYNQGASLTENTFTRTGYTFDKWTVKADGTGASYTNGQEVSNLTTENNGVVTLYAQWKANKYNVSFDYNGGVNPANVLGKYDASSAENTTTTLKDLSGKNQNGSIMSNAILQNGYIQFDGTSSSWVNLGYMHSDYMTLEATFSIDKLIDGDQVIIGNINAGGVVLYISSSNVIGVEYVIDGIYKRITSNITPEIGKQYHAIVSYDGNVLKLFVNGELVDQLEINGILKEPTNSTVMAIGCNPSRTNAQMAYLNGKVYSAAVYTNDNVTREEVYGTAYGELPTPTRDGYTFDGWYLGETKVESTTAYSSAENVRLVAKWIANNYTVRFDANGGTGTMANQGMTYDQNANLAENTYTREGYLFDGWNTKANGAGISYAAGQEVINLTAENNEEVTLYAQWKENKYTVKFNANGGTGTMADQEMTYNQDTALAENTFTKTGYTFKEWNTKADGTGISYGDKQIVNNISTENSKEVTLYAQWEANTYTIRFDANGGEGTMNDQQTTYDQETTLTENAFTRTGYTFKEWNTKADGTGTSYVDKAAINNFATSGTVTLYAQWTANIYTVNFYANVNSRLPEGYQEIEYLGSTGTQYIDTGVRPSNTLKTKINYTDTTATGSNYVMGSRTGSAGSVIHYGLVGSASGHTLDAYYNSKNPNNLAVRALNHQYEAILEIEYNAEQGYRMHSTLTDITSNNNYETYSPYYAEGLTGTLPTIDVFAINSGNIHPGMRLHSLEFYDGETLIHNFVPAYRISDGVGGLYDLVENQFHTNAKSGSFEIGPNKVTDYEKATQQFTYGESQQLIANPFEITGYTFLHWNTKQDDSGTSYNDQQEVSNLTTVINGEFNLYGIWDINTYTVKFDANNGTGTMNDMHFVYGEAQRLTTNTFTRIGYHFTGWNTKADGTGTKYIDGQEVNNLTEVDEEFVTLYAQWEVNKYSVEYHYILPAEYQQVEYIESTGSQYIDTGVKPTNTLKTEMIYMDTSATGSNYVLGSRTGTAGSIIYYGLVGNSSDLSIGAYYNSTAQNKFPITRVANEKYKMVMDIEHTAQGYRMNTTLEDLTASTSYDVHSSYYANGITDDAPNIMVFAIKDEFKHNGMRLYKLKMYDNGNLIRNFVPCYRKSDNVIGLYDMVNDVFYTNNGEGTFTKGADGENEYKEKKNQVFEYGVAQNLTANTLTKTGYTFAEWTTNPDGTGESYTDGQEVNNLTTQNNGIVDLYAQWEVANYTITYNLNGGTVATENPTTYNALSETFTLNNPTKEGYTFVGWIGSNGITPQTEVTITKGTTGDKNYIANWSANTYVVKFNSNEGTGTMADQAFTYGTAQNLTANTFTREGYTFTGWNTAADGTGTAYDDGASVNNLTAENNGVVNLYAQWKVSIYKITLNNLDATTAGTTEVWYEYNKTKNINGVIAYYYSDEECTTPISNGYYITKPTKTSYIFQGYYTGENGTGTNYVSADGVFINNAYKTMGDKTLYAYWVTDTYKITLDNQDATTAGTTEVWYIYNTIRQVDGVRVYYYSDEECTTPVSDGYYITKPTKTGYTFQGYYTGENGTGTQYVAENGSFINNAYQTMGDKTLYAKWTVNSYTVKFNANNGAGTMEDQAFTYGTAQNLTANTFTREGYTFTGWNTQADGNGTAYTDGQEVNNLTTENNGTVNLYAQWTANTYTVNFIPNRNILPSEYVEVGYLKTDGNQYINLGHTHPISTNTKVEIGAEYGRSWLYGYTAGEGGRYGGTQTSLYTGSANASWTGDEAYHDYVLDHSSGATIDGTVYSLTETPSGSSGTRDIYLFRSLNSTVFVEGKIYYYRQYENDTLVYNLIPCYRVSDNVAGMYDLVSNTFFTNAGTGSFTTGYRAQQFTYDVAQNLTINSYTRAGYTFDKWTVNADGTGTAFTDGQEVNNLTTENNGTVNLYAQWRAAQYVLTIDPMGGVLSKSKGWSSGTIPGTLTKTITYGGTYGNLPSPTKTGYSFVGWFTEENGGEQITSTTTVTRAEDHTLYAHWNANKYTVKFNANEGTGTMADQAFTYGTAQNLTANTFTRTGYTFDKWTVNADGTETAYEDGASVNNLTAENNGVVNLYAQWTANTYHVTYVDENIIEDNQIQTSIADAGDSITYNNGVYTINKASQYTGLYIPASKFEVGKTYALRFQIQKTAGTLQNIGGHAGKTTQKSFTIDGANSVNTYDQPHKGNGNIPNDTNVHTVEFVFTYTGVGGNSATMEVFIQPNRAKTDSVTVNISKIALYEVEHEATYTYGQALGTLPTKTKTGYMLDGWYTEPNGGTKVTEETTVGTHDVVYYAHWNTNQYSVKFNANNGTGIMADQEFTYGTAQNLIANSFTRAGYTFAGWNTQADGNGTAYADGASVNNLTAENNGVVNLYAQWTAQSYTVTFDPGDGASVNTTSKTVTFDSAYGELPTPTKEGYTFDGWYDYIDAGDFSIAAKNTGEDSDKFQYKIVGTVHSGVKYTVTMDSARVTEGTATQFSVIVYDFGGVGSVVNLKKNFGENLRFDVNVPAGYEDKELKLLIYSGPAGSTRGVGTEFENVVAWSNDTNAFTENTVVFMPFDHTLKARWTGIDYNVTFDPNGGTVNPTSKTVTYGSAYGELPTPTKEGYTFEGWAGKNLLDYEEVLDINNGTVTQVELNGVQTLSWMNNATGVDAFIMKGAFKENTQYTISGRFASSKENRQIRFYYTDGTTSYVMEQDGSYTPNTFANFSATSSANKTLDHIGGLYHTSERMYLEIDSLQIEEGTLATAYEPFGIRTADTIVSVADNHKLNALWSANKYSVRFNANGGTGTMADQAFTYNKAQNLTANTFTRTGYTFDKWTANADGTGTAYTDGQQVNNLTTISGDVINLYAQWVAHEYDVYFSPNRAILPSGYTELDYIESTGTQHIITDFVPDNATGISIRLAPKELTANDQVFFGTGNTESAGYWFGSRENGYYRWNTLYSGANGKTSYVTLNVDRIDEIRMNYKNNRRLELNGTSYYQGLPTLEEKTLPFAIFGYNNDINNEVTLNAKMRFYGMEVTQGSSLAAHYVPCYRNSDGKAGVYDIVGNTFYTNQGTGEFIKGYVTQHFVYGTEQNLIENTYTSGGQDFIGWNDIPNGTGTQYEDGQVVSNLSAVSGDTVVLYAQWTSSKMIINMYPNRLAPGYIELDYIEGTGTQYITTDVIPTNTTGAQLKMVNKGSASNLVYFGCGTAENDGFWIGNSSNRFYARFDTLFSNGNGNMLVTPTISNNVNYTFELNYLNDRTIKRNETTFVNNLPTLSSKTSPITIFGYYNPNDDLVHLPGKYQLYEFRISEGSEIIRNYVPCYRMADGIVGLYETMNGVFYPSEGTDVFIPGNEIKTTQEIYYEHSDNLVANTYTKDGVTFINWNTESDGSGTTYTDGQLINYTNPSSEVVNLYAQWAGDSVITINAGHGISAVSLDGWTNAGTSSMSKTVSGNTTIDLSTITLTYKNGYEGAGYTLTSGNGTITGSNYTVGSEDAVITVEATGLVTPAAPTVSGGTTKVYGQSPIVLSGTTATSYDSDVTLYYSFGYSTEYMGTPDNWTSASSSNNHSIPTDFRGTRFYYGKVYASDGTLTSSVSNQSQKAYVTVANARVNFNPSSGVLDGSDKRYVSYDSLNIYTAHNSSDAIPLVREVIPNLSSYSVEDEVEVGGQLFYIMNIDGDQVTLISKDSIGYGQYSASAYWSNYPDVVNGVQRPYVYDSNAMVYSNVNNFANQIASAVGANVSGRLISYEEANALSVAKRSLSGKSYWTGCVSTGSSMVVAKSDGTFGSNVIYSGSYIRAVITFNNKVYALPTASREGYNFNGWWSASNGGIQVVDANRNVLLNKSPWTNANGFIRTTATDSASVNMLYAHWTPITYTITYNLDDGTVSGTNPTSYSIESSAINLIAPTKTGYTFAGWTGSNGSTPQTEVTIPAGSTGDRTYTANWTVNTYRVTLNPNEGIVSPTYIDVTYGGTYEGLPTPMRTGYSFNGWYTELNDGTQVNAEDTVTITSNQTLYAHWTPNEYTITLNNQSATNAGTAQIYETYETKFSLTSGGAEMTTSTNAINVPTRTGYAFEGYYTERNGAGTQIIDANGFITAGASTTLFNENGTLYAKWRDVTNPSLTLSKETSQDGFEDWELSGGAFIDDNGTLHLQDSTSVAKSRYYQAEEPWYVTYDAYVTTVIPDKSNGGSYFKSEYYNSELTKINNKANQASNEWKNTSLALNVWTNLDFSSIANNNKLYGGNIKYITLQLEENTTYSKNPERIKNLKVHGQLWSSFYDIKVTASDSESGVKTIKYALGDRSADYFETDGIVVTENIIRVTENGIYTVCVEDKAGNKTIQTIAINKIDKTAPTSTAPTYTNTANSITVTNGQVDNESGLLKVEYAIKQAGGEYGAWQSSNVFSGLRSSTTYSIKTRATNNANLKTESQEASVTTDTIEYTITLDNQGATTPGTETIYEIYENRYSLTSGGTAMTPSTNPITKPEKTGSRFTGYYTEPDGAGTQIIDANGHITAVASNTQFESNSTIYANWSVNTWLVTFDARGGITSEPTRIVSYGSELGTLPTVEYVNHIFKGWYTAPTEGTQISASTIITENETYYAQWEDAIAEINGTYYASLTNALATVTTDTPTTIRLVNDTSEIITISGDQNITFDFGTYTLSNNGASTVIENFGNLTFITGNITSNTTVAAIINRSEATLQITGGRIETTGTSHAVYNDGGTVDISGGYISATAKVESSNKRGTVQNQSGTMTITGGTIVSPYKVAPSGGHTTGYAVTNKGGTMTIGIKEGQVDTTSPNISGEQYGINNEVAINLYDGNIKGKTGGLSSYQSNRISDKETNYSVKHYKVGLYDCVFFVMKHTATFDPNGGKLDTTKITKEERQPLGTLPLPTYPGHSFVGWFTSKTGGTQITSDTLMGNDDVTYYAHWEVSPPAVVDGQEYSTIQEAINSGTNVEIDVIADSCEQLVIARGQDVTINLDGHTVSNTIIDGKAVGIVQNNGTLTIIGGVFDSTRASASAIDNNPGGVLVIDGLRIVAKGTDNNSSNKQAVYNDNARCTIKGNTYLESKASDAYKDKWNNLVPRSTVHNINGGTMIIESGTIINKLPRTTTSANQNAAIANGPNSTLIIGIKDGSYNQESPTCIGKKYGVYNTGTVFNYYDGTFSGTTAAIYGTEPNEIEDYHDLEETTEVITIEGESQGETYNKRNLLAPVTIIPSSLEQEFEMTVTIRYNSTIISGMKAGFGATLAEAMANASESTATSLDINRNGYVYAEGIDSDGEPRTDSLKITNIIE